MGRTLSRAGLTAGAAVIGLMTLGAPPARAQMAVLDSANLEQTSQTLAGVLKTLDQARQQVQQLTSVTSTLGQAGAAADSGLSAPLRSLSASMSFPTTNFGTWNLPKELQTPNLGSFNSARDFVGQSLGVTADQKTKVLGYGGLDAAQRRRALAFRDAAWNGYALALQQKQTIQSALERSAALADQANTATTMMDQQRATNYLLAQIAGELTAQRSLMVSLLEVSSSQAIATSPVLFTGTSDTGAGAPAASGSDPLGQ